VNRPTSFETPPETKTQEHSDQILDNGKSGSTTEPSTCAVRQRRAHGEVNPEAVC
jgi:hypothetical protein